MYNDKKTAKDRLEKKRKVTGILSKRGAALKKKISDGAKFSKQDDN